MIKSLQDHVNRQKHESDTVFNREEAVLTGEDEGGGSAEKAEERSCLISAERRHLLGSKTGEREIWIPQIFFFFLDFQMSGRGRPCFVY